MPSLRRNEKGPEARPQGLRKLERSALEALHLGTDKVRRYAGL
jgi:hypothetical protein